MKKIVIAALLCASSVPGSAQEWVTPAKPKTSAMIPTAARVFKPGEIALAKHKGGEFWYPAKVQSVTGNLVTLQYSGGETEALPKGLVYPLNWKVGTVIQCKTASALWAQMTITALRPGYDVDTVSNAGKPLKTSLRHCRVRSRAAS